MAVLTLSWGLDVALVFLSAFVAAYLYVTRNFKYWPRKGVVEMPPMPFFGNFFDCCRFRVSPSEYLGSLYKLGQNLAYIGFYIFDKPALLLRDPEIIKLVLVKDFSSFSNRYVSTHESDTIAAANMFLLKNPAWKTVRTKVSPIFTSGKMKMMFPLMRNIGKDLVNHLENLKLGGDGRAIEVRDISSRFATDIITSCAFGLEVDSINDPESAFRNCGQKIFGISDIWRSVEFSSFFFIPALVKRLKFNFFSKEGSDFMRKVFTKTMTLRMESEVRRNDLIDLLIDIKQSQNQIDDPDAFKLEGDKLVGQAATFFAAGFETSSSTISFCLYELAQHLNIQSNLRDEITSALVKTGGEITYEMVMNLPYLDKVMSETLRKYPTLPFLDRVAVRDYKVPGTDLVIEEGTPVYISLFGLHYDPEYFPDPDKFEPERFSDENKQKRPSCTYMPFGNGPHNCVGLRFGLLVSKLGVFNFILNHEITVSKRTPIPLDLDPRAILIASRHGLFLRARRITPAQET